jgi:hypothetical protein
MVHDGANNRKKSDKMIMQALGTGNPNTETSMQGHLF